MLRFMVLGGLGFIRRVELWHFPLKMTSFKYLLIHGGSIISFVRSHIFLLTYQFLFFKYQNIQCCTMCLWVPCPCAKCAASTHAHILLAWTSSVFMYDFKVKVACMSHIKYHNFWLHAGRSDLDEAKVHLHVDTRLGIKPAEGWCSVMIMGCWSSVCKKLEYLLIHS